VKKRFRLLQIAGCSLVVMYLVLLPGNEALYDLVLFPFPDARIIDIAPQLVLLKKSGVSCKQIFVKTENGHRIHALFLEVPNTKRVFLYSHGKGNNLFGKIHVARTLLACGGSVLMYDYEGYGLSQGRASVPAACEDAVAAYDYLVRQEHRSPEDIVAYGESLGSGITGQLSLKRKLAGIIFQAGFASLTSVGRDSLFWLNLYPDWSFPKQLLDNVAVFKQPHPPLLMIHGTDDRTVRYSNALKLYEAALPPKMLLTVPHGNHGGTGDAQKYYATIRQFLKSNNI
jgi:fermentation-respiration switch protein FrsA (DUF1100 family)